MARAETLAHRRVLASVCLLSAAATTTGDGLRVTVGFVNLFNHSIVEHIPPLDEIYDLAHPRCSGDPSFVGRTGYAPATYCLNGVHAKDLKRVIGAEWWWPWESRVVQEWANVLAPRYDHEYDAALAAQVLKEGMPLKYDQFALERVCLAKWQRVASRGGALTGGRPRHPPEVVVVPSLLMHLQEQRWRGHLAWNLLLPKECVASGSDSASAPLPAVCAGQGYGAIALHRRYWALVRKAHFAPYAKALRDGGGRSTGSVKVPLVVVHHSFVWDTPTFVLVLQTLLEQPKAFADRVLVACLEANLKLPAAGFGLQVLLPLAARGPAAELRARRAAAARAVAASAPPTPLGRRRLTGSSNYHHLTGVAATAVGMFGRPLLVALPYPTGLSLASVVAFAPPEERDNGDLELPEGRRYDPHRRRPITVLLDASVARKGQGGGARNWVRAAARDRLLEAGAQCRGDTCALCHDHSRGGENSAVAVACGWPLDRATPTATLWEKLVASSFCLEPAGDTPTRSHLYAALLSGCVPVLFDGGLRDYPADVKTWWAWRDHGLRYEEFAVVVNASAVRRSPGTTAVAPSTTAGGGGALLQELAQMPTDDPARFLALRRGVDKVAALLRYSAADESESTTQGPPPQDAFQRFESIVREAAMLLHS